MLCRVSPLCRSGLAQMFYLDFGLPSLTTKTARALCWLATRMAQMFYFDLMYFTRLLRKRASEQLGHSLPEVLSKGLLNEDKVLCPRAPLPWQAKLNTRSYSLVSTSQVFCMAFRYELGLVRFHEYGPRVFPSVPWQLLTNIALTFVCNQ